MDITREAAGSKIRSGIRSGTETALPSEVYACASPLFSSEGLSGEHNEDAPAPCK